MAQASTISLSTLLLSASHCLRGVNKGLSLNTLLLQVPIEKRAGTQSITFYVMRYWACARALRGLLLSGKPPNLYVTSLLDVALCLLLPYVDEQGKALNEPDSTPIYKPFVVVNEAVKAAGKHPKLAGFRALINACLRRFLREKESLLLSVQEKTEVRWGFEQWWLDQWQKDWPQYWQQIAQSAQIPGPMTLRVNQRKTTVQSYKEVLQHAGISCKILSDTAICLEQPYPVEKIPGFLQGFCSVQDEGAQRAVAQLPLKEGMKVLDACSAPGGKTAHILESSDVSLIALDVDKERLSKVKENICRLGLNTKDITYKVADAAQLSCWWDGELFDIILADVPCTASGIIRRHPDIRWLRQPEDLVKTSTLQRTLVKSLWQTLKPGGYFLYATCSIFSIECQEQADWIAQFKDAIRLPCEGQLLPIPEIGETQALHDGFFYALFQKKGKL